MKEIKIEQTKFPKVKPINQTKLGFGNIFTDHMFVMNYDGPKKWHSPRILPYAPIALDPAAMCLQYALQTFEGLKANKTSEEKILLFRPKVNMARLNVSNSRMCIPLIDEDFCVEAIKKLVLIDKDWIPTEAGSSLYLRPFIIAVDPDISVKPAEHLMFIVICSPINTSNNGEPKSIKVCVEQNYIRASKGGIGFIKAGCNYSSYIKAKAQAINKGLDDVLWLDSEKCNYIEGIGNKNVFFVIKDEIITPKLNDSILPGITRDSVIQLLKCWGYNVIEKNISIDEIEFEYREGNLKEAFATDAINTISIVEEINLCERRIPVNFRKPGKISKRLYKTITEIQCGKFPDHMGWMVEAD